MAGLKPAARALSTRRVTNWATMASQYLVVVLPLLAQYQLAAAEPLVVSVVSLEILNSVLHYFTMREMFGGGPASSALSGSAAPRPGLLSELEARLPRANSFPETKVKGFFGHFNICHLIISSSGHIAIGSGSW